ncbi:MAG: ATP-binding cassette domain-containing protein [Corallococcus sp.]|nr:ATP-binding cassette domain-containing protein [Corallococcus sp.]
MAILALENLTFAYPEAKENALCDINLTVERGEFVVLCGESGCGKSTLLRLLKKQLQPKGAISGKIMYNGIEISKLDDRTAATSIGFVMQNPDNQSVTDKVWHELSFGLESLGEESDEIRRRVAEISGFFGINDWYRKRICELSGGQKQLLNLASVMVMQPEVLVLDEPTSQLDPIAASDFIATLRKINDELGMTIVIVEHRLEEVFPIAHKVAVMNKSRLLMIDTPQNIGKRLLEEAPDHKMLLGLPSAVRIFQKLNADGQCPLSVREGRTFLQNYKNTYRGYDVQKEDYTRRTKALEIHEGFFRYERNSPDVLNGLNLTVYENEILCILGGNGAGKTTTLKILGGTHRLYRGKLRIWGKKIKEYDGNTLYRHNISCLPQNPQILFVKNTLRDDLAEVTKLMGYDKEMANAKVQSVVKELDIEHLLDSHPFDLSGGEQQKAAFAKLLLTEPKIILLDEPTKGIDAYSKKILADILYRLKSQGKTIVIVTHDVEFAAEHADRCGMFFDGQIVSLCNPVDFFSTNSYYTTSASRISRGRYKNAVTVDMVAELCQKNGKAEQNG